MLKIDSKIASSNKIFEECKQSLTRQFVLTELKTNISNLPIYYWTSEKGIAQLEYIIQCKGKSIPIDVNYNANMQAKSLKAFIAKYNTQTNLRVSLKQYSKSIITNIPLYLIGSIDNILE